MIRRLSTIAMICLSGMANRGCAAPPTDGPREAVRATTIPAAMSVDELLKAGRWILSTDERSAAKQFSVLLRFEPARDDDPANGVVFYIVRDGGRVGYVIAGTDGLPAAICRGGETFCVGMPLPGQITTGKGSPRIVVNVDQGRVQATATTIEQEQAELIDIDLPSVLKQSLAQTLHVNHNVREVDLTFRSSTAKLVLADERDGIAFRSFQLEARDGKRVTLQVLGLGKPPLDIFSFGRGELEKLGVAIHDGLQVNQNVRMSDYGREPANRESSKKVLALLQGDKTILQIRGPTTRGGR